MRYVDAITATILLHTLKVREERMWVRVMTHNYPDIHETVDTVRENGMRDAARRTIQPGGPVKPMGTSGNGLKREGLVRALAAVKAQQAADVAWEGLAQRVERNNTRAAELALAGNAREQAKELLLDQLEREQALDQLESAIGANGGPPLSDTQQRSPPAVQPGEQSK